jgi:hypothetical protein
VKIMKKLLTIIVPLAMLFLVGSVAMATEEGAAGELNQELNKDISGNVGDSSSAPVRGESQDLDEGDSQFDDNVELNDTNSRETRALVSKRGRQPRRGSTASDLSEVQKYWGDHNSGKSNDETGDEDEDDDITPTSP